MTEFKHHGNIMTFHKKGPFIYDFTTKTTSDLATDGWTVGTGVGTDSGGFYGGILWYPMSQIGYVDATKKITIIQEFATGTVGSWTDALGLGLNENNINSTDDTVGEIYMGLMTNTNYKLRWIIYYSGGTVASNNFDWVSNTEYSATFIIDLANKSLNFELKLKSNGSTVITVTRALSDTEVSKFIGSPYLCTTNGSRGRIHNIRVIIA